MSLNLDERQNYLIPLHLICKYSLMSVSRHIPLHCQPCSPQSSPAYHPVNTIIHSISIYCYSAVHIKKAPSPNQFPFLNRKQFHSVSIHIICDAQNHILWLPAGARLFRPAKQFGGCAVGSRCCWRWVAYC